MRNDDGASAAAMIGSLGPGGPLLTHGRLGGGCCAMAGVNDVDGPAGADSGLDGCCSGLCQFQGGPLMSGTSCG